MWRVFNLLIYVNFFFHGLKVLSRIKTEKKWDFENIIGGQSQTLLFF